MCSRFCGLHILLRFIYFVQLENYTTWNWHSWMSIPSGSCDFLLLDLLPPTFYPPTFYPLSFYPRLFTLDFLPSELLPPTFYPPTLYPRLFTILHSVDYCVSKGRKKSLLGIKATTLCHLHWNNSKLPRELRTIYSRNHVTRYKLLSFCLCQSKCDHDLYFSKFLALF